MASHYITNERLESEIDALSMAVATVIREKFAELRAELVGNQEAGREAGAAIRQYVETRVGQLNDCLQTGLMTVEKKQAVTLVANKFKAGEAAPVANGAGWSGILWIRHGDGTRSKVTAGPVVNGEQSFTVEHSDGETCEMSAGPGPVPIREVS
jgi:hypothetical protein